MIALRRWTGSFLKTRQAIPGRERIRLFQRSRFVSAALILTALPVMAVASLEPVGVMGALTLFGVLQAAIAMDTRRAAFLDRSLMMALLAASFVLIAGTLRGLNGSIAIALLSMLTLEAILLARQSSRFRMLLTGAAGSLALLLAMVITEPAFGAGSASLAVAAAALVANAAILALAMAKWIGNAHSAELTERVRLADIEQAIKEAVIAFEPTGHVTYVSSNASRVLGLPVEAVMGRGLLNLVLVSERPAFLKAMADASRQQSETTHRFRLRDSAEEGIPQYRWAELTMAPSGHAALRDIDARVVEEQRIAVFEADAEKARNARSAFLTTVNHELRTPLNAIIGFSDILANPAAIPHSPVKAQEYAALINSAGRDLHRMISAMVDITRLDSGLYEIDRETVEIRGLIETVMDGFQHEPEGKNITITLRMLDKTLDVDLDGRAIRNALQQLLSNACKFGGANKPVVIAVQSNAETVTIAITDQGPGIPKDRLELLGRHFARLDEALNRERGGIGLGLSLARGIVALHQGSLSIESETGRGTTVLLKLPRHAGADLVSSKLVTLPVLLNQPETVRNLSAIHSAKQERRRA